MKKPYRTKIILVSVILILMSVCYYIVTPYRSMLGESTFYKNDNLELKVILMHENLFLHYVGNSYYVACQSENTKNLSIKNNSKRNVQFNGNGWTQVPGVYLGNGLGDNPRDVLDALVEEAQKTVLVKEQMTFLFVSGSKIQVTFNGCKDFEEWALEKNIPADLIAKSTSAFEACTKQQKKFGMDELRSNDNCINRKFFGENKPIFQDIVANDKGFMEFKVSSVALNNIKYILVQTSDFGKTWQKKIIQTSTRN